MCRGVSDGSVVCVAGRMLEVSCVSWGKCWNCVCRGVSDGSVVCVVG